MIGKFAFTVLYLAWLGRFAEAVVEGTAERVLSIAAAQFVFIFSLEMIWRLYRLENGDAG